MRVVPAFDKVEDRKRSSNTKYFLRLRRLYNFIPGLSNYITSQVQIYLSGITLRDFIVNPQYFTPILLARQLMSRRLDWKTVCFTIAIIPTVTYAEDRTPSFYPKPPAYSEQMMETVGIFAGFAHGNKSAGLELVDQSGARHDLLWSNGDPGHVSINGHSFPCFMAPNPSRKFAGISCDSWPQSIVAGRTKVYVRYFEVVRNNRVVSVATDIRSSPLQQDRQLRLSRVRQ
jgi:hypothetical protein